MGNLGNVRDRPISLDVLDPGIRDTVALLHDAGVHTFESCDGGAGHSFRDPTVKFYGTTAEGWRALAICKEAGLPIKSLERSWDLDDGEPSGPYWKVVFRRILARSS